jgi:hypothetical protein
VGWVQALSTGDDVAVDDAFSGTNLDGLTLTAFPAGKLNMHLRVHTTALSARVASGLT